MKRAWLAILILVVFLTPTKARSIETRTYEFVDTEPTYFLSCGECVAPYDFRGVLTGTFTIALDHAIGTGRLEALDAELRDYEAAYRIGESWEWRPYSLNQSFLTSPSLAEYRPPFPGVLAAAEIHPLLPIPSLYSFPTAEQGSLVLASDGRYPTSSGYLWGSSFQVEMMGDDAAFSFLVPAIDSIEHIHGARARLISVVPEPHAVASLILAIACAVARYRRASFGSSASRMPSPRKLSAKRVIPSAALGKTISHQ